MNAAILLPTMRELTVVSGYHRDAVPGVSDWGPVVSVREGPHRVTYALAAEVMNDGGRRFAGQESISLLMVVDSDRLLLDEPVPGDIVIADRILDRDGAMLFSVSKDVAELIRHLQQDWSGRYEALDRRLGGRGPRVFTGPVVAAAGFPGDYGTDFYGAVAVSAVAAGPASLARRLNISLILAVVDDAGRDTAKAGRDAEVLSIVHLCQDVLSVQCSID